jgi:hypothetical protein
MCATILTKEILLAFGLEPNLTLPCPCHFVEEYIGETVFSYFLGCCWCTAFSYSLAGHQEPLPQVITVARSICFDNLPTLAEKEGKISQNILWEP